MRNGILGLPSIMILLMSLILLLGCPSPQSDSGGGNPPPNEPPLNNPDFFKVGKNPTAPIDNSQLNEFYDVVVRMLSLSGAVLDLPASEQNLAQHRNQFNHDILDLATGLAKMITHLSNEIPPPGEFLELIKKNCLKKRLFEMLPGNEKSAKISYWSENRKDSYNECPIDYRETANIEIIGYSEAPKKMLWARNFGSSEIKVKAAYTPKNGIKINQLSSRSEAETYDRSWNADQLGRRADKVAALFEISHQDYPNRIVAEVFRRVEVSKGNPKIPDQITDGRILSSLYIMMPFGPIELVVDHLCNRSNPVRTTTLNGRELEKRTDTYCDKTQ